MKQITKAISFFVMTTLILCGLFTMLRFVGLTIISDIPNGQSIILDLKINLIVSGLIALYVVTKEIDKDTF